MSGMHWYVGKQALKESIARKGIDEGVDKWWQEWIHECFATCMFVDSAARKHPEIEKNAWIRAKLNLGNFFIEEDKYLFRDWRQTGDFSNPCTEVKVSVCILGKNNGAK